MELLIPIITGLAVLLAAPALPPTWRLSAALILSVPQLYLLPVADFYLSLAFISTLLLWPELIKESRKLFRQKILVFALALLIVQALSLFWSTDLRLGLRTIAYSAPFFLIAAATYSISKRNPKLVYTIFSITTGLMLFQALLVVTFRLYPELEMFYLQSNVSGPLSGPNVIGSLLDDSARNNVLDPLKAGGVYVNANIAASYLGMGSFFAFLTSRINSSFSLFITALLLWISTLFTGSKAGVMLAIALPLSAVAFSYYRRHDRPSKSIILAIVLPATTIILTLAAFAVDSIADNFTFAAASIDTASIRLQIWKYALHAFTDSPILGQGFGGWQQGYATHALATGMPTGFPPHNTLIYLWSQSGILAAIFGLAFMFQVMILAHRLAVSDQRNTRLLGLILAIAAGWLFIQGMGENSGHLGDPRQQAIFAALVGLAYATLRGQCVVSTSTNRQKNPT
jgi:O-antigen ligase